ncbi:MAG TPA: hypothetical protein VFL72_01640 [Acidimicrobiia bacterium]|nr:hypothetical protein [Acidimicrobiia bacterium]
MGKLTRDGNGDFARNPETAKRDAEAAALRSRSMTYQQIANHFGVTRQAAWAMVQRAMRDTLTAPAEDARQFELDRLDDLEQTVYSELEMKHYVVSHGKIIYIGDPIEPLHDTGAVLSCVDRLLRISERRSRLLGLDAPQKIEAAGEFVYQLVGVDPEAL